MLDIKLIRDDADGVKAAMTLRNADATAIDEALKLDEQWRELKADEEARQATLNRANKVFGPWRGQSKKNPGLPAPDELTEILGETPTSPEAAQEQLKKLGEAKQAIEKQADDLHAQIENILLHLPNVPSAETPKGATEDDNVVRKEVGEVPKFDFEPQAHWDIGEKYGLKTEVGGRISGSGFPFLQGPLARLERALINFFIDLHTREHGYTECWTPYVVRGETLQNSSQLPKFVDDMYRMDDRDAGLFLIPTAEVPLTSIHAGEILMADDLPLRNCAFTPCFRREAGAAGADTRGILRVHQFSKVELMVVTTPDKAAEEHERLTRCAETCLELLELPYRRLELCTADLGFGAARCYDLEVFAVGVDRWLEVSSCSHFGDFQARRAKLRYRDENKKAQFLHTLNGSGLAVPRTMIAILENFQDAGGKVRLPKALHAYYGAETL